MTWENTVTVQLDPAAAADRQIPVEIEADERPLSVDYRLYGEDGRPEPVHNQRLRALMFADRCHWLTYMWPIQPDRVDQSDLTFLVLVRKEATAPTVWDRIKRLFGGRRDLAGRALVLRATEVLPFVFGLALAHGVAHDVLYREGLVLDA